MTSLEREVYAKLSASDRAADTRLLAAAPDLLATLRLVLRGLDSGSIKSRQIFEFGTGTEASMKSLADIVRAAIAKAES